MTSVIQWYIAREGKQYGPLSDPEMGLFVKGGHLKPDDLVWRPGFTDWMPAYMAFPAPPPPAVPPPMTQPSQQGYAGDASGRAGQQGGYGQPRGGYGSAQGGGQGTGAQATGGHGATSRTGGVQAAASAASSARTQSGAAGSRDPRAGAGSAAGRSVVAVEQGFPEDEVYDDEKRGSRFGRLARIAAIVLAVAAVGWLTYQNRESVKGFISSMVVGGKGSSGTIDPSVPAFVVESGGAPAAIDARLQRTALWSVVKREFPDWYGERLRETAKLTSEKSPNSAVTKHLLEALVALRRKHANDALSASSPRLISIAGAFLANLRKISAQSTTTCYSFISQGEASPAIVDLVQKGGSDADLQAQVTAIFEAIAEGRKSPTKYAAPEKTDYDALAEQLTKLGWSQADLQLFADPRALARTSHDRVCKMVQDWFTAHIAVKDRAAQERLLIETLRPVVAG